MASKAIYYAAVSVGSIIGAYIPILWGADMLSFSSVLFSAIGGIIALVIVYKISSEMES
jgi:hypothetical protein